MPTLNAEDSLTRSLGALVPGVVEGVIKEVIIVDGGSEDSTLEIAEATLEDGVLRVKATVKNGENSQAI